MRINEIIKSVLCSGFIRYYGNLLSHDKTCSTMTRHLFDTINVALTRLIMVCWLFVELLHVFPSVFLEHLVYEQKYSIEYFVQF